MKGQLYEFYRIIEKQKGNLANPYMSFAEKSIICLSGFAFVFFVMLIITQIILVFSNSLPIYVPIVTFILWVFCSKLLQKVVNRIFDKTAFIICEEIEAKLYGEDK